MNFRDTLKIEGNDLVIGGLTASELRERFGTPLYVMDESYIREVSRSFQKTIEAFYGEGAVAFASKAFSAVAMYKIINSEGLSIDVVSGGELFAALRAGFPPERIYFHGNNKLFNEIEFAVLSGVGNIVIDHPDEIEMISAAAKRLGEVQSVMLRINPGIEAHTYAAVQTATPDSKFGWAIEDKNTVELIKRAAAAENLVFSGLHAHIGSQIFEISGYEMLIDKMTSFIVKLNGLGIDVKILNLGGGFGITYTEEDPEFSGDQYAWYVKTIAMFLSKAVVEKKIKRPFLVIEPGRSIVGEAGVTLYTVGAVKTIPDIRKYIAIDGGMFDNPRYALYGSKYSAIVANKAALPASETVTICGKCCESGDIIAKDIKLAPAKRGDIIAVFATGAYNYTMAMNYNMNPIPPVVLVQDGKADYIVKPQTYEDLIRNNCLPDWLK